MKNLNRIKAFLPYNLQFFAEPIIDPSGDLTFVQAPSTIPDASTTQSATVPNPTPAPPVEPQLSAEEQLAKVMAESKRLKAANDKLASENAVKTKQLREKMSEKEQLDLEKAERDASVQAEIASLRRESSINKMAKTFIAMGYTEDNANKASEAQLDGDFEEVARIQQTFITARDKQREAEWMKKAPMPPAGNHATDEDLFLKGFNK